MKAENLAKSFEPDKIESLWYQYWEEQGYFRAASKSARRPFSIVIPPPNVTGILHMGHALNNTLQDIMIRYRRMQGYNALWMPGTDHAGIATQNVVEQELAKQGISRHELGRDAFVERVWEWKKKYGGAIIGQLKRLGCSCDWSRERFTMDAGLSRAVREVFVRLYNDGLIYQGDYIVNWCPRCHTAISDLEVEYNEESSQLWEIRYPFEGGKGAITVATTRPETMLGDTAVAVNPNDERYKDVIGKYVILPLLNRKIPIIADEYVTMEFGSGAVKVTPSSDPADFAMAERHHLETIKIIDGNGVITEHGGPYQGQDRYEAREHVVADLEKGGFLVGAEAYTHNVGKCYRCKTDIEPMVSKQWFVKVKPLAKQAVTAVVKGKTKLIPPTWEATFFDWMNNIRDWCISRQIWWGHRIPVWYCDACGQVVVSTEDPAACPGCSSEKLRQEEDVLDTWFSSALWPFSTLGWPEKTDDLKTFYPTSLLITGFDILFFWVARMMMMGIYVMKDVPFRDVYLHALVRDEKGEKMSKSKGNVIDPIEMIEKYGADAFRFTLTAFTAQGRDIRMSEERIEGYRHFINKIWNAAKFTMMNLEDYPQGGLTDKEAKAYSLADRWIRSRLNKAAEEITRHLDEHRFNEAAGRIYQFFWLEFCDWYVELVKPVLYGQANIEQKRAAQETLLTCLTEAVKLLHPIMPFLTEELWHALVNDGSSVMVSHYPVYDEGMDDPAAERDMDLVMQVIGIIRNIRGEMNIMPAKKLKVILSTPDSQIQDLLKRTLDYITNLARLEEIAIEGRIDEPKGVATGVVGSVNIYVFLEGVVDIAGEKARLEKEIAKLKKDLSASGNKLANSDFKEKAAEAVIKKEEVKFAEIKDKLDVLEAAAAKFRSVQ